MQSLKDKKMVSAEKSESDGRAAGKRSRGASPNGHYSDFSDEEREGRSSTKFRLILQLNEVLFYFILSCIII